MPAHAHEDDYGIGSQSPSGDAYKQAIFSGLSARRNSRMSPVFRFAFVDFALMWSAIIDNNPPGFKAFGYTSNQYCDIGPGPCCDPPNIWYASRTNVLYLKFEIPHSLTTAAPILTILSIGSPRAYNCLELV